MNINEKFLTLLQSYLFGVILFALILHVTPFNSLEIEMYFIIIALVLLKMFDLRFVLIHNFLTEYKIRIEIFFMFLTTYFILNINSSHIVDYTIIINFIYIICIFSVIMSLKKTFFSFEIIMFFVIIVTIINVTFYVSQTEFSSNMLGVSHYLLCYIIIISILKVKSKILRIVYIIILLLNVHLVFITNSRTSILSLLVFILVFIGWKYVKNIKFIFGTSVIIINVVFINIYLQLYISEKGQLLNQYIISKTGKSFFSGRNIIWDEALNVYLNGRSLWFGQGSNFRLNSFEIHDNYLHNIYIQLLYQFGLLGVCLFIVILLLILKIFIKDTPLTRVSYAFFISLIVMQTFEGFLLSAMSIPTFLGWVVLGIIINFVVDENKVLK